LLASVLIFKIESMTETSVKHDVYKAGGSSIKGVETLFWALV